MPFDVSEQTLRDAAAAVPTEYAGMRGPRGRRRLRAPPRRPADGGTRLVAFLGSTIGNLVPAARAALPRRPRRDARARRRAPARHRPREGRRPSRRRVRRRRRRDRRVQPQRPARAQPRARRRLRTGAFHHVAVLRRRRRVDRDAPAVARPPSRSPSAPSTSPSTSPPARSVRTEISAKFRREGVERELAAAGLELGGMVDRSRRRLRALALVRPLAAPAARILAPWPTDA